MHRYREAEQLHLRALAIWEKTAEPYPNDRANCLNNLAALYESQGKTDLAIPRLQQAVTIWEAAYTRKHPISATGMANLAAAYGRVKQFTKPNLCWWRRSESSSKAFRRSTRTLPGHCPTMPIF